jgi:hypothetical protein
MTNRVEFRFSTKQPTKYPLGAQTESLCPLTPRKFFPPAGAHVDRVED